MNEMPGIRSLAYCCYEGTDYPCQCSDQERYLRAIGDGYAGLSLTVEQRAWCLEEIKSMGDSTDQGDFNPLDDHQLARQVILAWRDYCLDKGTL